MTKVSYIVPLCKFSDTDYKDRLDNINFALSEFIGKQENIEIEIACIEQSFDGQPHFLNDITFPKNLINKSKLVSYPKFNKGWLCNIGYNLTTSEHICIADGDMFINNPNYFQQLIEYVKKNNLQWCIGWNICYYLNRGNKTNLMEGKSYELRKGERARRGGPEGGIVYFQRAFYKSIGGMNEWMPGLGGMDNDIAMRAVWRSSQYRPFNHTIGHLYHIFSPMKSEVSRKANSNLYRYICTRPRQAIVFMESKKIGNPEAPLCDRMSFMSGNFSKVSEMSYNTVMNKKAAIEQMSKRISAYKKVEGKGVCPNIFGQVILR
jgi:glycosyltransferase involved in cell wall biosynthesis